MKTTAADRLNGSEGQSIIEFLMAVPVMMGLILLLIRVNTVIQIGIVNQQHARGQALTLASNNQSYPHLGLVDGQFNKKLRNQMILGVSDNAPPDDGSDGYVPMASTSKLGSQSPGASEDKGDVERRDNVRVRNTVTLCTPTYVAQVGGSYKPLLEPGGIWQLSEGTTFDYCMAPREMYSGGGGS